VRWLITIQDKFRAMEIGQKVEVYRLRDRVNRNVAGTLGKVGIIKEYRMTDGSGVGVVVQFEDRSSTWFFEDEIKPVN
jgi:hypothetical protein